MCRNIRILFNFAPPVTEDEIRAASLQFVRKVSGFNKPSKANEAAFEAAVPQLAYDECTTEESGGGGYKGTRTRGSAIFQMSRMHRSARMRYQ